MQYSDQGLVEVFDLQCPQNWPQGRQILVVIIHETLRAHPLKQTPEEGNISHL